MKIYPNETRMNGKTTFNALGRTFDTRQECEKWIEETVARRQSISGFPLTEIELNRGPKIAREGGWNTPGERVAAETFQPVQPPPPKKELEWKPIKRPDEWGVQPPEERMAEARRDYEARKAQAAGKAASKVDPKRLEAIAYAAEVWEKTVFNPDSTERECAIAGNLLKQAEAGCLDHFQVMANDFSQEMTAKHEARLAALNESINENIAKAGALAPPPNPFTTGETNDV